MLAVIIHQKQIAVSDVVILIINTMSALSVIGIYQLDKMMGMRFFGLEKVNTIDPMLAVSIFPSAGKAAGACAKSTEKAVLQEELITF